MKNMGIALLIVAGIVLLGVIARLPYAVWVMIDLGVIIVCGVVGFKLLKKQQQVGSRKNGDSSDHLID